MKKIIFLSFVAISVLSADETSTLDTVNVVEDSNSKLVKNVSKDEIKSADLAEALSTKLPDVSIVRRSGIANDIIVRGQKKDNINVMIDNAKIYGACPNRMDAPISHVLTNNIDSVKIIEGPYDVENFGTLSGLVQVKTKDIQEGIHGDINLNAGSFDYKKASATVSGGNDFVKALISASTERGGQYKDGNGNNFLDQQRKRDVPYASQYKNGNMDAFEKKTVLTKLQFNFTDNQDLKLSYTANRSDKVLYPTGMMDAEYDDSNIYTIDYAIRELGSFSKELDVGFYYSDVDHPMSNAYRNRKSAPTTAMENPMGGMSGMGGGMMKPSTMAMPMGGNMGNMGGMGDMGTDTMVSKLKTSIWGAKVKNSFEAGTYLITYGLDTSVRNWRAVDTANPSIPSTDTKNKAIFLKINKTYGDFDLEFGSRYDYTDIVTQASSNNKTYTGFNANLFTTYNFSQDIKYFLGFGKSSRVPDARELYNTTAGNPDLKQTENYEVDLGVDATFGIFNMKPKIFYSKLKNYIYNTGTFENIDAEIYGFDISGYLYMTDNFYFDYGVAYQKGQKTGDYKDKDLAEIPPLKANIALNYEHNKGKYTAEVMAVDRWSDYDESAKEQELGGYAVVNLKYSREMFKHFEVTLGVDNLFDKTYNSTNTYEDISYVTVGGNQILFNDPGRYGYINLRYSF